MKTSDFDFTLPPELIAQYPLPQRSASRLLCVQGATLCDTHFSSIVERLNPGDLLVFNNTRVIPARLLGEKETGGKVEVLIERIVDSHRVLAHVRASKSPKTGSRLLLESALDVTMLGRQGELFELHFNHDKPVLELLEQYGHMPLPPYITRVDDAVDQQRYQTVYARHPGAVAAPTAGLHFDNDLLNTIKQKGIETAFVTLHVGAGTFQPVRVANIHDHTMHAEYFDVTEDVVNKVKHTRQRGGRVIAVGTTAVRSLESAARDNELHVASGDTQIFIFPGYQFKVVDALITNFHLPQSTLLMLVCAFGGYDNIMAAYRHAVQQHYRFFSYGDAMFVEGRAS